MYLNKQSAHLGSSDTAVTDYIVYGKVRNRISWELTANTPKRQRNVTKLRRSRWQRSTPPERSLKSTLNARNCADDTFFHRSEAILKAGGFVSAFCCARPAVLFQTARWLESANMLQQIAGVRKSNMLLKCMCIRDAEFESEFAPNLIHEGQLLRNQTVEIWNLRSEKERNWMEKVMVWPSPAYFRPETLEKGEKRLQECRMQIRWNHQNFVLTSLSSSQKNIGWIFCTFGVLSLFCWSAQPNWNMLCWSGWFAKSECFEPGQTWKELAMVPAKKNGAGGSPWNELKQ